MPLIITNDLQLPSIENQELGGGSSQTGLALQLEDNIDGTNSFLVLEANIDTGYLESEDNI